MLVTDAALAGWLTGMGVEYSGASIPTSAAVSLELIAAVIGVVIVVVVGKWLAQAQGSRGGACAGRRAEIARLKLLTDVMAEHVDVRTIPTRKRATAL